MMATEPTLNKPDAPVPEPALTKPAVTSNDVQDAGHPSPTLNGTAADVENKQIADIVDELIHSAEVSVSGGSDTEASKADPSKRFGDKSHARTSSTIKKPHSFKSVSVNRTFLASKQSATTARPDSSAGLASTTPQPAPSSSASRLKLVAKSGSSLGGSTKTLSSNGKPAAAPDPNTVWNRNRPIPQPEQKKLSDEELMHKYGIHMADRLGPEDTKGQSNWADIDDDEEWAPETITWTDGTKITLPQAEEIVPSPKIAPATLSKEPTPAPPKSKSPVPTASATGSPSVKPGVLAAGKSLVLKGAPEKPTLVAKPPAPPTPAKSPWARLPPVEKIPPVHVDAYSPASRPAARDLGSTNSAVTPTKEIAADDFSRSGFRDGHPGNHSQLYNSHSGRYEPVTDRRGSRNESYGRQPAVLQRPPLHDQQGPAEPSAAFQTSRTSGHEAPYGRRRGSSNVSGTSGSLAHNFGRPHDLAIPPPELLQPRSDSVGTTGAESPVSARTFSPANTHQTPRLQSSNLYQPRPSPGQTHSTPHYNPPTADAAPQEEDFEIQKKIMRERRENAIRRRIQEEIREEEAKQARLAEKLKAMGPAPERNSAKKEGKKEDPLPSIYRRTSIPAVMEAQSRIASEDSVNTSHSLTNTAPTDSTKPGADARVNGDARQPVGQAEKVQTPAAQSANVPKAQQPTSWLEAPQHPERFPLWSGGSQNVSRNVWGAPGNDRSLGNGTFNPDLGTLPDSHPAPINERSHRPAPIGPPRSTSQHHVRPEPLSNSRLPPIGPPRTHTLNMSHAPERAPDYTNPIQEDDRRRALEMQEKIKAQETLPMLKFADNWHNPHERKRGTGSKLDGHNKPQPDSSFNPPTLKVAKETADDKPMGEVNGVHPKFERQHPVDRAGPTAAGPATRGGSRFFPSSRDMHPQDNRIYGQARTKSPTPPPPTADGHPVFDGDATRPHVSLPPARPIVKLPPSISSATPSPVVPPAKLAPASFAAAAAASSRGPPSSAVARPPSRNKNYGGISQTPREIASQENWQDRINSLMGKKLTPPAKSLAVDSSSRIALEHIQSYDPATVALPGLSHSVTSAASDDSDYTSKEMAEECFGEQEMGSLPAVRLPSEAPDALWQAVEPNFDPAPVKLRVDATGAEALRFSHEVSNGKSVIRVSAPFMTEAKTVLMPFANNRSTSNPRRAGPSRGPRRLSSRGGQRGGREHGEHAGDHASSHSSSRPPSTRSGRGGYRARTENWGRHTSAASAAPS
ncbi:hypothetical protein F4677DRAFT_456072 [Hypoxylon crocopeplum]|nr:hypothetical protein F4677DRAFT_456072 [Hypoxylon crocopeplum]